MIEKVQKWGNSQGLRLSKTILEEAQIGIGDEVHVLVEVGQIIIRPVRKTRGKYQIKDLVSKIPETYEVEELDCGTTKGKEEW